MNNTVFIPGDVPLVAQERFRHNYNRLTRTTQRAIIVAYDHKIEHLNDDFIGPTIPASVNEPEHIFSIVEQAGIGTLATQPGMIARYAMLYPTIPYIAKLNSKTNIVGTDTQDPYSAQLWSVEQVLQLVTQMNIEIIGVGYTIYLGSSYEDRMLQQAATIINQAHAHGLIATLWIYPRGKAIQEPHSARMLIGAAGVANALGADFVKLQMPLSAIAPSPYATVALAAQAAGNTKIIASGGTRIEPAKYLQTVYDQITYGNCSGIAVGRNVYQHTIPDAVNIIRAAAAIVYDDCSVDNAIELLTQ
ncbi:aldolase [Candidatus Dependentiae bacterium]|nr:aldolase [Candidatus Dependentiae bacterium]